MFYVFTYIIYGITIAVLYGLNELINHQFDSWKPRFLSSYVLELLFFSLLTLRGLVTTYIFIDNIHDMFVSPPSSLQIQYKRNFFSNNDTVWYREVQPLLNTMIRRQVLDIFSRGVSKAIRSGGVMENNEKVFNNENGVYRGVLTEDRYYKETNAVELETSIGTDKERMRDGERGGAVSWVVVGFCEYCPIVFSYMRYLSNISNESYIAELQGVSLLARDDM